MVGPRVVVVSDARSLARRAAEWIVERVRASVAARGRCAIALAGGSTPGATYELLGASTLADAIPWGAIDWFFGDERAVPFDDPESNYGLVAKTLFAGRPEGLARVHRMPADAADADVAAREYGRLLPDPLDVLILGMGEDGHTASLFPGSSALEAREARVVPVTGPKPPASRMTVAPAVIEGARDVLVLVAGGDKAAMLARALEGPLDIQALPIQLARGGTFIVDREAAHLLTTTHP